MNSHPSPNHATCWEAAIAKDKVTGMKTESPIEHPRMRDLMTKLRGIRRANAGIGRCLNVLMRHRMNLECTPHRPEVYIQLTAEDAACLEHAIEACSRFIDEAFETLPVFGDVMWDDKYLPEVRHQA